MRFSGFSGKKFTSFQGVDGIHFWVTLPTMRVAWWRPDSRHSVRGRLGVSGRVQRQTRYTRAASRSLYSPARLMVVHCEEGCIRVTG